MNNQLHENTTKQDPTLNRSPHAWVRGETGSNVQGQRRRSDHRTPTLGLMAILSDRNSEYYCIVDDVSEQGFRLGQIQHDFDEKDGEYRARVLAPFDDIALTAKPRWTTTTSRGMHKTIGFRIENPPDEWRGFIGKLQKKTGEYNYLLSEDETGGATQ